MSVADILSKIAVKGIELDAAKSALEQGKIPYDLLNMLDAEIATYETASNQLLEQLPWTTDDYGVSVQVLLGNKDIPTTVQEAARVSNLFESRLNERAAALNELERIGDIRFRAIEADLSISDATDMLKEFYDDKAQLVDGFLGGSQLGSALIEIEVDLLPRLSNRSSALIKLEKRLAKLVENMDRHINESSNVLESLHEHFQRVIDSKVNDLIKKKIDGGKDDALNDIREGSKHVVYAQNAILSGNEAARKRVREIERRQVEASRKQRNLNGAMAFIQIGLALAGMSANIAAAETGGAQEISLTPTASEKSISTPITKTVKPIIEVYVPQLPVKIGGSGS